VSKAELSKRAKKQPENRKYGFQAAFGFGGGHAGGLCQRPVCPDIAVGDIADNRQYCFSAYRTKKVLKIAASLMLQGFKRGQNL